MSALKEQKTCTSTSGVSHRNRASTLEVPSLLLLDVGHGNSAVLIDTEGVSVIDCAPGATLLETLVQLGISQVRNLLISHADSDHLGGAAGLLLSNDVTVQNVYINPDSRRASRTWAGFLIALEK